MQFVPPGIEFAKRALSHSKKIPGMRRVLRECWEERHKPLVHAKVRACRKAESSTSTTCLQLGICLCSGGSGRVDVPLGTSMSRLMRRLLRKRGLHYGSDPSMSVCFWPRIVTAFVCCLGAFGRVGSFDTESGCGSGAVKIGHDQIFSQASSLRHSEPLTTPITSSLSCFRAKQGRRRCGCIWVQGT